MNIENQVVSFAIAKQLKEVGVKQESIWYYRPVDSMDAYELVLRVWKSEPCISAFTVAELGQMLPSEYLEEIYKGDGFWQVNYNRKVFAQTKTEADARGLSMLSAEQQKKPKRPKGKGAND